MQRRFVNLSIAELVTNIMGKISPLRFGGKQLIILVGWELK